MSITRKVMLPIISLAVIFSSASAYDTKGKLGMGIRICGTPLLLFSNLKIGISNVVGLEPSVGFHQLKLKQTITDGYYDPYDPYNSSYEKIKIETSYNVFMISNIFDFKPVRKEKSNFLLRAGIGYWKANLKNEEEYEGSDYDFKTSIWNFQIKGGFGIEHFFTDHFGVYAGFMNAWGIFGSDESSYDSVSFLSLGNQFAELSFTWYL